MLSTQADMEVVGEACSCSEACPLAASIQPDVVILDPELEDASGNEAIVRLRERFPELRAMIYTDVKDQTLVAEALRNRIRGYVLKKSAPEQLLAAVRAVAAGDSYLDPAISALVLAELNPAPNPPSLPSLSARERTILGSLAEGRSNKEIAQKLFITERTVKFHVSSVLRQLGARNRTQAVMIAEQMGLLKPTSNRRHTSNAIPVRLVHSAAKT